MVTSLLPSPFKSEKLVRITGGCEKGYHRKGKDLSIHSKVIIEGRKDIIINFAEQWKKC